MISAPICPNKSLKRIIFKLRHYREAANFSQKEAAEKLNIGHRSYQRIENGEANCDISFLHRFSLIFGVNFIELVTPYPPLPNQFSLYNNEMEQGLFEVLPFIQQTKFLDWAFRFEKNLDLIAEGQDFISAEYPMCFWTPSKKIMNNSLVEAFGIKKIFRKVNFILLRPEDRMNFLDCLYYYRPKYTIKKHLDQSINGFRYNVEIFSAHFYRDDEVMGLSVLRLSPFI